MTTNYIRGRAFEYRVRNDLIKKGWYVFRTAGSHTVADLIAVKDNSAIIRTAFIQCKLGKSSVSKKEMKKINDFIAKYLSPYSVFWIISGIKKKGRLVVSKRQIVFNL